MAGFYRTAFWQLVGGGENKLLFWPFQSPIKGVVFCLPAPPTDPALTVREQLHGLHCLLLCFLTSLLPCCLASLLTYLLTHFFTSPVLLFFRYTLITYLLFYFYLCIDLFIFLATNLYAQVPNKILMFLLPTLLTYQFLNYFSYLLLRSVLLPSFSATFFLFFSFVWPICSFQVSSSYVSFCLSFCLGLSLHSLLP